MATWTDLVAEAPDLAAFTERRLLASRLMLLATLRRDGFPRISPVEPEVEGDELALHGGYLHVGMMGGSAKALDLRRDPRCGLHTATTDKDVAAGEVKMWGRAIEILDEGELERFAEDTERRIGWRPPAGRFHVFLIDLAGVSSLQSRNDAMLVTTWKPGEGTIEVERRD